MQTTTTPIAARSVAITHKPTRRPHAASRRPASEPKHWTAQPAANQNLGQSPRQQVVQAFRDMAHGVAPATASEHTRSFYRSSGQAWARALTEQGGSELRARVLDAFRNLAHGVQDTAANTRTLHFYRSSGQSWAKNLG